MTQSLLDARLQEDVEQLVGSRRGSRNRAAVRIEDIAPLLQIAQTVKAQPAAGANPTMAEYNALLDDVRNMHAALSAISQAIQQQLQR